MRCPNCLYKLVLLPHRLKYKCAKCGKVFLQKFIENKEFNRWNKFQRELDIQNQKAKRSKLSPEEKRLRAIENAKKWQKKNPDKCREYCKRYYEKNRNKYKEKNLQYYEQNKERILTSVKQYNKTAKNKINATKRMYRLKNLEKRRLFERIAGWRQKQKLLAQQGMKEDSYSFSTFGLSELLDLTKTLLI